MDTLTGDRVVTADGRTILADPPAQRLWRRAVASLAWDVVVDGASAQPSLDEVLGDPPGSFCVRLVAGRSDRQVIADARRSLTAPVPWVLMLEVEQLPIDVLEGLAAEHAVLLLVPGTTAAGDRLVRAHPDHLEDLLPSGKVHGQDCLLAGPLAVGPLLSGPLLSGPRPG